MNLKKYALTLLVSVVTFFSFTNVAYAHNDVNIYYPDTGELIQLTPDAITLTFATSVSADTLEVSLLHSDGRKVPLTGDGFTIDGKVVSLLYPALDVGTYVLTWQDAGPDGHLAVGQSHFSVGQEDGVTITDYRPRENWLGGIADILTRLSVYFSICVLLGMGWLMFTGIAKPKLAPLVLASKLLPLVVFLRFLVVAYRSSAGNLPSGVSRVLTDLRVTPYWGILFSGAALSVFVLHKMRSLSLKNSLEKTSTKALGGSISLAGLLLAAGLAGTGHMGTSIDRASLVPLSTLHISGFSLWFGSIIVYFWGSSGERNIVKFAKSFSVYGILSVLSIGVTGILMASVRTGVTLKTFSNLFGYAYGNILTIKWLLLLAIVLPVAGTHLYSTISIRLGLKAHEPAKRILHIESIALAAIILAGSVLGITPPSRSQDVVSQRNILTEKVSYEECLQGSQEGDRLICVSNYFIDVANTKGMSVALLEVSTRWKEKDPWLSSYCHVLGHKLGRLGYRTYQNIEKAFAAGTDPCDYGYLHGVIEGASSEFTDQDLRKSMTTLCAPVAKVYGEDDHMYKQCVHGLGHAAARRVNNNLARGMEFCREYAIVESDPMSGYIFKLCVTGVSMEWNTQTKANDARTLPIGDERTLLGQCLLLDEIFQGGCLEYGTSSMGGILEREIEARNWCDVNLKDPLPCYQSIGRDVIWSPTITKEQAIEVCIGGKQGIYAQQCIERALGSVATIALDANAIDDFCPLLPLEYRKLCPIVKKSMIKQIDETLRGTDD